MLKLDIGQFDAPFAAHISGVDLSSSVTSAVLTQIDQAFTDNAVLCFRDQSFQSPDEFLSAAKKFGDPVPPVSSSYRLPGYDAIEELSNHATDPRSGDGAPLMRGGSWHTDHSNLRVPPKATMLYAISVPMDGGNTEFTNLTLAYAELTDAMKDRLRGRRVFEAYLSRRAPRKLLTRTSQEQAQSSGCWQPLVRRHPQSMLPGLYFNPMRDDAVDGMTQEAGDQLLDELYAHCEQPKFRYSHEWRIGDVLIWDNRCTWHRATFNFDQRERRYLHRIMLAGELPIAA